MRNNQSYLVNALFWIIVAGGAAYPFLPQTQRVEPESRVEEPASALNVNAPDFAAIRDVNEKKQQFFAYLRPSIAQENARIEQDRTALQTLIEADQTGKLTPQQHALAVDLGQRYRQTLPENGIDAAWRDSMLQRIDVIPEALVLTQAANESAWGTSRFAREANNYFGQWCYTEGCGLVPSQRQVGKHHEVKRFASVQESVHGYFVNINSNAAYADMRQIRFQRRQNGDAMLTLDAAVALSQGLLSYSERGEAYIQDLQTMMRHNARYWTAADSTQ